MIYHAVQRLTDYAICNGLIGKVDQYVVRNQFMEALGLSDWEDCESAWNGESIDELLTPLVEHACRSGIIADTPGFRDLFDTKLMGILTPMPREVNSRFLEKYALSPEAATDDYYDLNRKLNYVRADRMAKDIRWTYRCEYGILDITINLSKPEKDPRDIASALAARTSSYPRCPLCPENAGFAGHAGHPARQNLRPVSVNAGGEEWMLQYSPYGYYNEHCIVFNTAHVPMKIDSAVFGKLFDIIDFLPHYFVGSNADLPIVGGSILSHEHFQGGRFEFAMAKAPVEREITLNGFDDVRAGIVRWPLSTLRLSCADREALARCCTFVLEKWRGYTDSAAGIFAETNGVPHNTVTPIARKKNGLFECDLVLRNNITSPDRPLGVFHPNPSLHHIKKENIGLIEAMGLAVLPARLAKELTMLEKAMLDGKDPLDIPELSGHAHWASGLLACHPEFCAGNARSIIEQGVGSVFLQVLCDAGVFKRTPEGAEAFMRFASLLG